MAEDPDARVRDVADTVGVTERAAQRILSELEEAGYLSKTRDGRRNRYTVDPAARMRHPMDSSHRIGELVDLLTDRRAGSHDAGSRAD
ncbi:winged helix-turn-helix domain-containing protein [Clavibacter nebraskensis]|uniref:winged helix-turn-helix domain-containing protein n=1 Tax=Clavibacter nebraskensis TaxID=31963 RepID=UPI001E478DD3|nr:winged helix-turn-helix domain-containing protein [Clavibacter nebraskensis]